MYNLLVRIGCQCRDMGSVKITDEHKKALDWLNDHTSDEISFYGLQLELWQIGMSEPAVKFNVVSQPNRAVRQASKRKNQEIYPIQRRLN